MMRGNNQPTHSWTACFYSLDELPDVADKVHYCSLVGPIGLDHQAPPRTFTKRMPRGGAAKKKEKAARKKLVRTKG
jgi:hypothetical protein